MNRYLASHTRFVCEGIASPAGAPQAEVQIHPSAARDLETCPSSSTLVLFVSFQARIRTPFSPPFLPFLPSDNISSVPLPSLERAIRINTRVHVPGVNLTQDVFKSILDHTRFCFFFFFLRDRKNALTRRRRLSQAASQHQHRHYAFIVKSTALTLHALCAHGADVRKDRRVLKTTAAS